MQIGNQINKTAANCDNFMRFYNLTNKEHDDNQ